MKLPHILRKSLILGGFLALMAFLYISLQGGAIALL
jgi:hypothetical protein